VALVGSWARGAAREDSDIDLVVITSAQSLYEAEADWARPLGVTAFIGTKSWGRLTERRAVTASGLEVEFGITTPAWAATDPLDPGTRRVVNDGIRVVYDPKGMLAALVRVSPSAGCAGTSP